MIGLVAITGVEAVAGETLSCVVWKDCQQVTSSGETKGTQTSIGNIFGGYSSNGGAPSGEQQVSPGNHQQAPQQPAGAPVQPGARGGAGQPGVAPKQDQPGVAPEQGGEPPAQPGAEPGRTPAVKWKRRRLRSPAKRPRKDRLQNQKTGKKKEDRGYNRGPL